MMRPENAWTILKEFFPLKYLCCRSQCCTLEASVNCSFKVLETAEVLSPIFLTFHFRFDLSSIIFLCFSPSLLLFSHWFWCQSYLSPHTQRRFPQVQASTMTSQLTRGCLTTTTGRWQTQRPASTMVRRRTVMGAWWRGSTGSSSPMVEHRLSGKNMKCFLWQVGVTILCWFVI